jgi:hypothetical protein
MDSTATSMTGAEWRLELERQGGDHWTGAVWVAEVSSAFEINDLGSSRSAERFDAGFRVKYKETVPGDRLRSYDVEINIGNNWLHEALDDVWSRDSWGRARVSGTSTLSGGVEFLNYWRLDGDIKYRPEKMSRTATRGGPLIRDPSTFGGGFRLETDPRPAVSVDAGVRVTRGSEGIGDKFSTDFQLKIRPSSRVLVELGPEFKIESDGKQPVSQTAVLPYAPTFDQRYLFGDLERRSFGMATRVNVTFTPYLTLEIFAEPLITAVDYVAYKQLDAPETFDFDVFDEGVYAESGGQNFCQGGRICRNENDQFVDFDGDGVADYSFVDKDFNERSLLGNVVLRWEFRPGSAVFLVWQHEQLDRVAVGDFDFGRDIKALFGAPSSDTVILKVDYLLGL